MIYDRNPQTFVPNIFAAQPSDYKVQTHRISRTPPQSSRIIMQVLH